VLLLPRYMSRFERKAKLEPLFQAHLSLSFYFRACNSQLFVLSIFQLFLLSTINYLSTNNLTMSSNDKADVAVDKVSENNDKVSDPKAEAKGQKRAAEVSKILKLFSRFCSVDFIDRGDILVHFCEDSVGAYKLPVVIS